MIASTTAQRRKGGTKSLDAAVPPVLSPNTNGSPRTPVIATVKRNKFGTSPFDENWLNLDCCGLFCAGITYCLHVYGVYAVCLVLLPPWMSYIDDGVRYLSFMGHLHRMAFTFVAIMAVYAHFKAMTTDPGAVPPDAMPLEEAAAAMGPNDEETGGLGNSNSNDSSSNASPTEQNPMLAPAPAPAPTPRRKGRRLCRRCNAFKPQRAHHCSVCQRCIIKMDHHCPWVNNCVGIGNHKYFLLFVMYTFISCVYSVSLVVTRFFYCMNRTGFIRTHHHSCLDRPTQLLSILGLIVEAIMFGLFTCCMMVDQAAVVTSKLTHIDRLKGGGDEDVTRSSLAGVIEVFGLSGGSKRGANSTGFRADWLSPFAKACFPASIQDEIMGFCRPCIRKSSTDNDGLDLTSPRGSPIRSVTEIV